MMRWLTTKTLFNVWQALMWGDERERKLFLQSLAPIVDEAAKRAAQEVASWRSSK